MHTPAFTTPQKPDRALIPHPTSGCSSLFDRAGGMDLTGAQDEHPNLGTASPQVVVNFNTVNYTATSARHQRGSRRFWSPEADVDDWTARETGPASKRFKEVDEGDNGRFTQIEDSNVFGSQRNAVTSQKSTTAFLQQMKDQREQRGRDPRDGAQPLATQSTFSQRRPESSRQYAFPRDSRDSRDSRNSRAPRHPRDMTVARDKPHGAPNPFEQFDQGSQRSFKDRCSPAPIDFTANDEDLPARRLPAASQSKPAPTNMFADDWKHGRKRKSAIMDDGYARQSATIVDTMPAVAETAEIAKSVRVDAGTKKPKEKRHFDTKISTDPLASLDLNALWSEARASCETTFELEDFPSFPTDNGLKRVKMMNEAFAQMTTECDELSAVAAAAVETMATKSEQYDKACDATLEQTLAAAMFKTKKGKK